MATNSGTVIGKYENHLVAEYACVGHARRYVTEYAICSGRCHRNAGNDYTGNHNNAVPEPVVVSDFPVYNSEKYINKCQNNHNNGAYNNNPKTNNNDNSKTNNNSKANNNNDNSKTNYNNNDDSKTNYDDPEGNDICSNGINDRTP